MDAFDGRAYDKPMCEPFFATLECVFLDHRRIQTAVVEDRSEAFSLFEGFYNTRGLHSTLDNQSPGNFAQLNDAA